MSIVIGRSCLRAKCNILSLGNRNNTTVSTCLFTLFSRNFSGDDKTDTPDFINSTILVENGLNVQELPVIVRKLKDLSEIEQKSSIEDTTTPSPDSVNNYHLIQSEFKQCVDLRDVFSLLSKCTKITPNIALGAMERICDIEKNPHPLSVDYNTHVNLAKGAILDKLLKVVTKTEDTQTIINVLNTDSIFMEPYKHKFCQEILFRAIDNKVTLDQLCEYSTFLLNKKYDPKYSETIDKLWVAFVGRENEINEKNIVDIFKVLPGLKVSKRIIFTLLEQKLCDLWPKIKVPEMQDILNTFLEEKYSSMQSFAVFGRWFFTNIHALDEDSLLDVVTKFTRLNYTDHHIERGVEKYMKLKGSGIESHVLIVGILNYCMQFHIRNKHTIAVCSKYFVTKGKDIPPSFLKSFIYPFGYLYFDTEPTLKFCDEAESIVFDKMDKVSADDMASIILSFIYSGYHSLKLIGKIFNAEYLVKVNTSVMKKLHLIDTALSLECEEYAGPRLPKDQWSKPVTPDVRVKNIIEKVKESFIVAAGGEENVSTAVIIPYLYSHETYLIDVMIHPPGLGSNTFNWKLKSAKNEITAILIHLPDHYCSDGHLIGPQVMKKKHLKLLGMKVVSLKYSAISKFYTSYNTNGLREYIKDAIKNAELC